MMKLYYVETNAYDMIVFDNEDFIRVHVVEDKPENIPYYTEQIADFATNLSGEDYYGVTASDLIGDANVIYTVER